MPSLYRIEVTFSSTEDLFILTTQSVIFMHLCTELFWKQMAQYSIVSLESIATAFFIQDMPWVRSIIVFMRFSIHGDDELFVIHTH